MNNTFFYSKINGKDIYMKTKKTTENYECLTKPFKKFGTNMKLSDNAHLKPDIYNHRIDNDIKLGIDSYLVSNNDKNKGIIKGVEEDIKLFDKMHNIKLI